MLHHLDSPSRLPNAIGSLQILEGSHRRRQDPRKSCITLSATPSANSLPITPQHGSEHAKFGYRYHDIALMSFFPKN